MREALSQEGLTARRRLRHARVLEVGEALAAEGVPISAAELAGHALAAGDRRRTVALSQEAARRALQLGAVEETVAHLEQALAFWPEDGSRAERAELLRETGRLRLRGSRGDEEAMAPLEEALAEFRALGEDARRPRGRWRSWPPPTSRPAGATRRSTNGSAPSSVAARRSRGSPAALWALDGLRAGPGAQQAAWREAAEGWPTRDSPGPPPRDGGGGARPGESPRHARDGRDLPQTTRAGLGPLVEEALALDDGRSTTTSARPARTTSSAGPSTRTSPRGSTTWRAQRSSSGGTGSPIPEAFYAALSGYALAEAGDWDAAERRIADAEALAGASEHGEWTRWTARCASALVALGRGELEDAREGFAGLTTSSLCRQSPNHCTSGRAPRGGGVLLVLGRAEEALAEVEPILASSPGGPLPRATGRKRSSVGVWARACRRRPAR